MKKFFLTLCVALFALGAQAQEKGDFALGVKGGLSFTKFQFADYKENITRGGFGAFAQYNISNKWRLELEGIYHPKKEYVSDLTAGLNIQYLVDVCEGVKIYPQVGYALAFVHQYDIVLDNGSTISHDKKNTTDGGAQLGLGAQFNIGEKAFLLADYKFQPGIFGDCHVVNVGIGFRF